MKSYTALVKAHVKNSIRAVPVEIRALSAVDAKWLLQAVYGFNAIVSGPSEVLADNEGQCCQCSPGRAKPSKACARNCDAPER